MTYLQALILGIVQGITEFLPISSSGHLVIIPYLLGWNLPEEQVFPFDVLVQFSTLFAVLIYYRKDIIQIALAMWDGMRSTEPFKTIPARIGWLTILATIPAGVACLLLKDVISDAFSNPQLAAAFLLVTAGLLFLAEKLGKKKRKLDQMDWKDAGVMGIAQAFAVFPGISRSGSTISGGLLRGLERKTAGQFAFLMAIPIMGAAGILSLIDLIGAPGLDGFLGVMAIGFVTSGVVGYFAIKWLLQFINTHSLTPFAFYCAVVGTGTLLISFFSQPGTAAAESAPVNAPIIITYQSSASWLVPEMQACSVQMPDLQILINRADTAVYPSDSDVHVSYGEISPTAANTFQIGKSQLVAVTADNNPIQTLSLDALKEIFSGEIATFADLSDRCPQCAISENAADTINIWIYPEDDAISYAIEEQLQVNFPSTAFVAPTVLQMGQVLAANSFSIGFLPAPMVGEGLRPIEITDSGTIDLILPILASSMEEPGTPITQFLQCLQQAAE